MYRVSNFYDGLHGCCPRGLDVRDGVPSTPPFNLPTALIREPDFVSRRDLVCVMSLRVATNVPSFRFLRWAARVVPSGAGYPRWRPCTHFVNLPTALIREPDFVSRWDSDASCHHRYLRVCRVSDFHDGLHESCPRGVKGVNIGKPAVPRVFTDRSVPSFGINGTPNPAARSPELSSIRIITFRYTVARIPRL